jgi:hypothetical protein
MHTRESTLTFINQLRAESVAQVIDPKRKDSLMLYALATLGEWAPALVERFFKIYFSPIFRGLASYLLHQLVGIWAAI